MVVLALALPWEDLKEAKRHCVEDVRRTEGRREKGWIGKGKVGVGVVNSDLIDRLPISCRSVCEARAVRMRIRP